MSRIPREPAKLPEPRRASKVCSICHQDKLLAEFYRRSTGGASAACKSCAKARTTELLRKKRREAGVREVTLQPKGLSQDMRLCTACKQVLPIDCFEARSRGGYRENCRNCRKIKKAEYKAANRAKLKASDARYREQRRSELRERQRTWREQNRQRYYEIHAKWKRENRDACHAMAHRRRLTIKEAGDSFKPHEWQALKTACDNRCLLCGRQEPDVYLTKDHIIPPDFGGTNTIENLQPLCGVPRLALNSVTSCNSSKYQTPVDYRPIHVRLAFGFSTRSHFTDMREEGKRHSAAIDAVSL